MSSDPPSEYTGSSYKDDPNEEDDSREFIKSSTARHIELTNRTNELLSNFGNMLNELGDRPASPEYGEFGSSTALQAPRSDGSSTPTADNLSPFHRSYSDRNEDVSYEPAGGGQNLWNTGNNGYYDYDEDRKKLYRYRMFGGNNMAYVCTLGVIVALVVIAGVSIGGKQRENAAPTTATVSNENTNKGYTSKEQEVEDLLLHLDKSYMPQDPETREQYLAVAETFRPQWFDRQNGWEGQAYLQAYDFCDSQNRMQPCPYMAICPGGQGNPPFGGIKPTPGTNTSAWAPVKNVPNEWVQISYAAEDDTADGEICQLYSTLHNGSPRWGLTGEYDEGLTQNILCCLVDEAIRENEPEVFTSMVHDMSVEESNAVGSDVISRPPSLEEDSSDDAVDGNVDSSGSSAMQENTANVSTETRVPEIPAFWYSRSDGWEGTTYTSANEFCSSQGGKTICPFQLYCPDGPGGVPFAASAQQALLEYDSLFWSPVMNGLGEEAWAGIGMANQCVPPLPTPRVSPDMLYQATSFIMCCEMGGGKDDDAQSSSAATEMSAEITAEIVQEVEEFSSSEFMQAAKEVWDPKWFSSEDGWAGSTYADAINFCNENLQDGELCPYQAVCPNGVGTDPYLVAHIPPVGVEQWVPIRTGVFSYILISHGDENGGETLCDSFQNLRSRQPELGTTAKMQERKQYLLCCHHYSGDNF
jgi:hypothetical protein